MMRRYEVKAAELGVGVTTVRRWVTQAEKDGPAGLARRGGGTGVLDRVDPRWLDTARSVLARNVKGPRPVRALVLTEIEERLKREFGVGAVKCPGRTTAYETLERFDGVTIALSARRRGTSRPPASAHARNARSQPVAEQPAAPPARPAKARPSSPRPGDCSPNWIKPARLATGRKVPSGAAALWTLRTAVILKTTGKTSLVISLPCGPGACFNRDVPALDPERTGSCLTWATSRTGELPPSGLLDCDA